MLGEIIKEQRENIGWSQEKFAEKCRLSAPTIWQIENGVRPSKKSLTKILNTLCLTEDDLLKDDRLDAQSKLFLENKKSERLYYGRV